MDDPEGSTDSMRSRRPPHSGQPPQFLTALGLLFVRGPHRSARTLRRCLSKLIHSCHRLQCIEWWSYEIMVIISAYLSNPHLRTGVIAICADSQSLLYTIPAGMAAAVSTRVSNELGAGNPQAARRAVNVARILGMLEASSIFVVLLLARNVWGRIYSGDKEVVTAIAGFIPFVAISSAFDALQTVLSGVIRGAGWQQVAAYVNLGSFYFAGVPTGCLLAFIAHLEGKGLWMGLIVGTTVQFLAYTLLVWLIDWTEEAKTAAVRVVCFFVTITTT